MWKGKKRKKVKKFKCLIIICCCSHFFAISNDLECGMRIGCAWFVDRRRRCSTTLIAVVIIVVIIVIEDSIGTIDHSSNHTAHTSWRTRRRAIVVVGAAARVDVVVVVRSVISARVDRCETRGAASGRCGRRVTARTHITRVFAETFALQIDVGQVLNVTFESRNVMLWAHVAR